MSISHKELTDIIYYNPDTGIFTWKISPSASIKAGEIAGSIYDGYVRIMIRGRNYRAHRLAYFYMTGEHPKEQVDHINGIRNDNRWSNIRECYQNENQQNRKKLTNNTSGYIGVSWNTKIQKWHARIGHCKKIIHLGFFDTAEEAYEAYLNAKSKYHTFQPTPRE